MGKKLSKNSRSGESLLALVLFAGIFTLLSLSLVSFKFSGKNSGENFFSRTTAAISKTFGNIFSSGEKKPLFEIDLNNAQEKNTNAIKKVSVGTAEEKTSPEDNKSAAEVKNLPSPTVSENKKFSPAATESVQKKIPECDISKTGNSNHKIIFSEINWMGSKTSAGDEWIEIKNNSGEETDLNGWQIISGDRNVKITFGPGDKIKQGSLYLLERTDDYSAPNVPADKIYTGALSNSGEVMKIFDSECNLSDEIDASSKWPAGDSSSRKTMERSYVDFSWHTSASEGGTPKKENSAAFAVKENMIFAAPGGQMTSENQNENSSSENENNPGTQNQENNGSGRILIAEIQITGGSGKSDNDFIKIFNAGGGPTDISGWQLKKRNVSGTESSVKLFSSGSVVANQVYFTWANSENGFASTIGANTSSTQYLSDNNSVALFDNSGNLIDAVAWGSGHSSPFAEISPYPANPGANQILSRKSVNGVLQDTDNNENDFEIK